MKALRIIADPDMLRLGIVIPFPGREGEPYFLYGFTAPADKGTIGITNAPDIGAIGLPLWRFRSRDQAEAAAEIVATHARLDIDGETRFLPEAREARSPALQRQCFLSWARRITPEVERIIAERGLGAGAYPLAAQSGGSRLA